MFQFLTWTSFLSSVLNNYQISFNNKFFWKLGIRSDYYYSIALFLQCQMWIEWIRTIFLLSKLNPIQNQHQQPISYHLHLLVVRYRIVNYSYSLNIYNKISINSVGVRFIQTLCTVAPGSSHCNLTPRSDCSAQTARPSLAGTCHPDPARHQVPYGKMLNIHLDTRIEDEITRHFRSGKTAHGPPAISYGPLGSIKINTINLLPRPCT